MDSAKVKAEVTGDINLYENQLIFEKRKEKKKLIYSMMFLVASVISLILLFVVPIFKYTYNGENISINGEYTAVYIIQKYFANELGTMSFLNTGLIISMFALIILTIYTLVASVMNFACKKAVAENKLLSKLFNYGMLEILSTVLFVVLLASMLFCKIDVSGNAENGIAFWMMFVTSIVMICTSIPLSDK